jgi:hypothetical protein
MDNGKKTKSFNENAFKVKISYLSKINHYQLDPIYKIIELKSSPKGEGFSPNPRKGQYIY